MKSFNVDSDPRKIWGNLYVIWKVNAEEAQWSFKPKKSCLK